MAHHHHHHQTHIQEDGWPLGLDRLNVRIGLNRTDYNGSVSFSTLLTPTSSISCTDFSTDLDTQSTESFFHDRSINLGSLLRVSSILRLSRRSTGLRPVESARSKKNTGRPLTCLYLLCSKPSSDETSSVNRTPTLGFFLEEERRASVM